MESFVEIVIKIGLLAVLAFAGLCYWIVPKMAMATRFRMSEPLYVATNVIGIMCGLGGLAATVVWPERVISLHLWELILIPFVLIHTVWAIIMRVRKTRKILDEKQEYDMTQAAAATWTASIPLMVLVFVLYQSDVAGGLMWFPVYIFATIAIFSASTAYFFRRA